MSKETGKFRPWDELRRPRPFFMVAAVDRLRRLSLSTVLAAAVALMSLLGLADYWTEADLSFLIFYLAPVFLATIRGGLWPGFLMSAAGTAVWFLANANQFQDRSAGLILWNLAVTLGVFAFFTFLLSALGNALDHEREMSRYDPLTGVANRRYFLERLDAEIRRCRRYPRPFTLVYMDLDRFKDVNDQQGHAAGDVLLRKTAELLARETRDVDVPGRLGGDEFALLLPETGYDGARAAIAHLRSRIAAMMSENGWPVTTTMGAITFSNPAYPAEEMIGMADRLMYSKKVEGKDGVAHRIVDGREVRPLPLA